MRHIFIADAHLRSPDDGNYRNLLDFLQALRGTTDTLFILGDLFEFWIGHRSYVYPHYLPVLGLLREIRQGGTKVVYFEGNHDFHLGSYFTQELKVEVFPGPAVLEVDGRRTYLCHGDEMNRRDYGYRLLRLLFHCAFTRNLALVVPPGIPSAIAERLGRSSRKHHRVRRARWDFAAIARGFAAERFAAGCDMVVTGHFHQPFTHSPPDRPGHLLVSLGDWITQYSYGEMIDGCFTLKTWKG